MSCAIEDPNLDNLLACVLLLKILRSSSIWSKVVCDVQTLHIGYKSSADQLSVFQSPQMAVV